MKRTRIIFAVGVLGYAAASSMAVPANAEPWGHDQWGTNMRAQNCDCSDAPKAATQTRQTPIPMAKQTSPRSDLGSPGAPPQQR